MFTLKKGFPAPLAKSLVINQRATQYCSYPISYTTVYISRPRLAPHHKYKPPSYRGKTNSHPFYLPTRIIAPTSNSLKTSNYTITSTAKPTNDDLNDTTYKNPHPPYYQPLIQPQPYPRVHFLHSSTSSANTNPCESPRATLKRRYSCLSIAATGIPSEAISIKTEPTKYICCDRRCTS